jgi:predicted HTH transcriptional regulator
MQIIIYILIGVVIGLVGYKFILNSNNEKKENEKTIPELKTEQKQESKQKILDFLQENEKITNKDVENLCNVSDATATRYLDELEKEEKIKQIGATGPSTYYRLK